MVKEIFVQSAFGIETPPDSDPLMVLDAYNGCQFNCPYCFQKSNTEKNHPILVKRNIVEILEQELKRIPKDSQIFLGSMSDPFMPLEEIYRLSRGCLELLNRHNFDVIITTKADTQSILSNLDLFKRWNGKLQVLIGFSNFTHYLEDDCSQAVETVNRLKKEGIDVKAFITPVLPGITDVPAIQGQIDKEIPIFIDKLRIYDHNREGILSYIESSFPKLSPLYREIIEDGIDKYYQDLCNDELILKRCQFTFPDSKM